MFRKPPISVDELISRMKDVGIANDDVEKFQNWIDENGYDYDIVKEDVQGDKEDSELMDCFIDELKDERIFDIVKAIIDNASISTKTVDYILGKYASPKTIDYILGKYYETCGINAYYDENSNGKFSLFLNNHGLNSDAVIAELENKVDLKDQKLVKFGIEHDYYPHEMYEAVQFCYKYKRMPITMHNFHLLSSNEYIVKWEHINNVIK
eukprot:457995_1